MVQKIKKRKKLSEEEKEAERLQKEREQIGIEDEFQAKGFELATWAQDNSKVVVGAIFAVIAVGVVIGVMNYNSARTNRSATTGLVEARAILDEPVGKDEGAKFATEKERQEKARDAFSKVVQAHSGARASVLARLYVGSLNVDLGDADGAITAYNDFLKALGPKDPLQFAGFVGLGYAYDLKGSPDEAIAHFEKAIALPGDPDKSVALWQAARLYQATGKPEKARARAEELIEKHANSPLKSNAESLLSQLPQKDAAPAEKKADDA